MAEDINFRDNYDPSIKPHKQFEKRWSEFARKRGIYAKDKKKEAWDKIKYDYDKSIQDAESYKTAQYNRIKSMAGMGAADNDPDLSFKINQAYKDADDAYNAMKENAKANYASSKSAFKKFTEDHWYEGFDEDAWDKQQEAKKKQEEATENTQQKASDKSSATKASDKPSATKADSKTGTSTQGGTSSNSAMKNNINLAGLSSYFASRFIDAKDPQTAHLERQAEMHDQQAADEQKNAQQNFQIANRDYRVEAEKNAASQAAAENVQKVHNIGNTSAGAAALERDVKSADYNTHMQRSDTQRQQGVENQRAMWSDKQEAERRRAAATGQNLDYKDSLLYNYTAKSLSKPTRSNGISINITNGNAQTPANTGTTYNGSLQNITNALANSGIRRTQDANGNVKGWRIENGVITRAPEYDNVVDQSTFNTVPEYTTNMEHELSEVAKQHPEFARKENEPEEDWTTRINNDLGRGGNLGDPNSSFYDNQGNNFAYDIDDFEY